MTKVVLATNNPGKLREFQLLFKTIGIEIIPQTEFNVPEVEETGLTFVENAILKARQACYYSRLPSIADDSGLIVDALGGRPGIYSARFAGKNVPQQNHYNKLLQELRGVEKSKRTARFCCTLVFLRQADDPAPIIAQAFLEGEILLEPRGTNGFGYDPVFSVPELKCSNAELTSEQKNKISHRGKALATLMTQIKSSIPCWSKSAIE